MPLVTIRPKGQVTIPVNILQQLSVEPYDQLEVKVHNGIVTMVPAKRKESSGSKRLQAFIGIGRGYWGDSPEKITQSIEDLRDSWDR